MYITSEYLVEFSVLYITSLLVVSFIHSSVYMSITIFWSIPCSDLHFSKSKWNYFERLFCHPYLPLKPKWSSLDLSLCLFQQLLALDRDVFYLHFKRYLLVTALKWFWFDHRNTPAQMRHEGSKLILLH